MSRPGEILGFAIGAIFFGNALLMILMAYGLATCGYFLVRLQLNRKPDVQDGRLQTIGNAEAQDIQQ